MLRMGCVIMAAGAAARFGGDKLAARVGGRSLLERALDAVPPGLFAAVAVVSARPEAAVLAAARGFRLVANDRPQDGVSRTIRLGLDALGECDGALFLVADQPFLTRETVSRLAARWREEPGAIVAAAHGGRRGNPCLFPRDCFPELRRLAGDRGGGAVIRAHLERLRLVEVPARELEDIDTPQALADLGGEGKLD